MTNTGWPVTYRGAVYPWHCDHMGHMNVMWYVGKFDEATWNLFALGGISPAFLRAHNRGLVAVKQEISYQAELLAGDVLEVRSQMRQVGDRRVVFYHEMRNGQSGEVCAGTELTGVYIDRERRKSCPFPPEIAESLRALIDVS